MFKFLKRLFGKEDISESTIEHASKGDYIKSGKRMKGGGHGQEALDYMDLNGIAYNIVKTYPNGVRVGNVPGHKTKSKQSGTNQSWFPKDWDRTQIKKAGQAVARGRKYPDRKTKSGRTKNVDVGIKRINGKIATIFPLSEQKPRKKSRSK